jgi:hypothetical protein
MPGSSYLERIRARLSPGEDELDVVEMIDLLSQRRAKFGRHSPAESDAFAATILCILARPVKSEGYEREMREIRRAFSGIRHSGETRATFEGSLTPELLTARSADDAIRMGVAQLFAIEVPSGGRA